MRLDRGYIDLNAQDAVAVAEVTLRAVLSTLKYTDTCENLSIVAFKHNHDGMY